MCANRGGGKVHLGVDSALTPMPLGKECCLVGGLPLPPQEQAEKEKIEKITSPCPWAEALTTFFF